MCRKREGPRGTAAATARLWCDTRREQRGRTPGWSTRRYKLGNSRLFPELDSGQALSEGKRVV